MQRIPARAAHSLKTCCAEGPPACSSRRLIRHDPSQLLAESNDDLVTQPLDVGTVVQERRALARTGPHGGVDSPPAVVGLDTSTEHVAGLRRGDQVWLHECAVLHIVQYLATRRRRRCHHTAR